MTARALAWAIDPMGDDIEGLPPAEVVFDLRADWTCVGVAEWGPVPRRVAIQGARLRRMGHDDEIVWFGSGGVIQRGQWTHAQLGITVEVVGVGAG
jgi:hypothetical protein